MNLSGLRTEAQRLAGRVDSEWNSRTRRWLNEALEQYAIAVPWPTLIREEDFTSAGTRALMLPPRVKQVQWVADKTNSVALDASDKWDREFPTSFLQDTNGAARMWREVGVQSLRRDPASAGILSAQADVSCVCTVFVEGLVRTTAASGTADEYYTARDTISIAGSNVTAGTVVFTRIDTLAKSDFTAGDLTVFDASSNVLARVPAFSYRSEYRRVELLNIPTAGTVLRVRYLHAPTALVNDTDFPHTSVDDEYLIWYAAGMIHEAEGQEEQAKTKMARAAEILNRRIYKEQMHGDRDLRAFPEPGYHNFEDLDGWPPYQGGGVY